MNVVRTGSASFLASVAVALYALPAMAAEGEAKVGLPQLDTSLFPEQLFWLAVSFATLYVLMAFVALPGVKRTQDKREATISSELSTAAIANDQAKAMMAQSDKALADARTNAQATVDGIKTQAAKEAAERQAAQHKELTLRLHEAEKKIHTVRNMAVHDAQKSAAEISAAIVDKLLGARA